VRSALRLAVVIGLAALVGPTTPGEAALPAPPFTLEVTPARVGPGQPVRVQITPRGEAGEFDIYLMWEQSEEAAFLTPEGAWSPRPVAFRPRLPARGAPVTLQWIPTPPGDIPLALLVLRPGEDPMTRAAWTFRPVVAWVAATPAQVPPAPTWSALAPLAGATFLACGLVVLGGAFFR
jgi:hypothetical protein